jgi:hypothetical protein
MGMARRTFFIFLFLSWFVPSFFSFILSYASSSPLCLLFSFPLLNLSPSFLSPPLSLFCSFSFNLNSMVLHPIARVSQKFVELHRTQPLFIVFHSFILILITRHVSVHFSGHLQAWFFTSIIHWEYHRHQRIRWYIMHNVNCLFSILKLS